MGRVRQGRVLSYFPVKAPGDVCNINTGLPVTHANWSIYAYGCLIGTCSCLFILGRTSLQSVVSPVLLLLVQWDWEGIFCNLSCSWQTKTERGAGSEPSTLMTKAFSKGRSFWNSLTPTCQINITYDNSDFYIFTREGSKRTFSW